MKIGIGSDHGGYDLKQKIKDLLAARPEVEVTDFGTYSPESVDYPDFAIEVARRVSDGTLEQGILICTTGVGMSMTANKFPRVRAALVFNPQMARLAREHNNANILALGSVVTTVEDLPGIIEAWFAADFEPGTRHDRRVDKINPGAMRVSAPEALPETDSAM
jgi:ribose 5-phosphate isomerase B